MVSSGEQGAAQTVRRASSRENGATEYSSALALAPSNSKTFILIWSRDPHDEFHGIETAKAETQTSVSFRQSGQRWISIRVKASINCSVVWWGGWLGAGVRPMS